MKPIRKYHSIFFYERDISNHTYNVKEIKFQTIFEKNLSVPLEEDSTISGYWGVVAIWVTHPPCP